MYHEKPEFKFRTTVIYIHSSGSVPHFFAEHAQTATCSKEEANKIHDCCFTQTTGMNERLFGFILENSTFYTLLKEER